MDPRPPFSGLTEPTRTYFQTIWLLRGHFEDRSADAITDERVSVGESPGTGHEPGEEVSPPGRANARPAPPARTPPRLAGVPALGVDRQDDLVHRGIIPSRSAAPVVEHQDVSRAGPARGDPVCVMLSEQPLIRRRAGAIGLGIAQR